MPISMADQFKGLPMEDLIGGPLMAACNAQVALANATAGFIQQIGFEPKDRSKDVTGPGDLKVRNVDFRFSRPRAPTAAEATAADAAPVTVGTAVGTPMEDVVLSVPLLAIVKVPALAITTVDITFDMEVKNSETTKESEDKSGSFSADAQVGWGPFSLKVHVEGSVATHKENTRQTDQSAKYHVEVHAEDKGMPEGLARVLDMLNQAIAPKATVPQAIPTTADINPPPKLARPASMALGEPPEGLVKLVRLPEGTEPPPGAVSVMGIPVHPGA